MATADHIILFPNSNVSWEMFHSRLGHFYLVKSIWNDTRIQIDPHWELVTIRLCMLRAKIKHTQKEYFHQGIKPHHCPISYIPKRNRVKYNICELLEGSLCIHFSALREHITISFVVVTRGTWSKYKVRVMSKEDRWWCVLCVRWLLNSSTDQTLILRQALGLHFYLVILCPKNDGASHRTVHRHHILPFVFTILTNALKSW